MSSASINKSHYNLHFYLIKHSYKYSKWSQEYLSDTIKLEVHYTKNNKKLFIKETIINTFSTEIEYRLSYTVVDPFQTRHTIFFLCTMYIS